MSWRSAASRSLLAAVRGHTVSCAPRLRVAPLPSAPSRRIHTFPPLATPRPLVAMIGSPAALARLTGHSAASARSCCELSQDTPFCRTCQDR